MTTDNNQNRKSRDTELREIINKYSSRPKNNYDSASKPVAPQNYVSGRSHSAKYESISREQIHTDVHTIPPYQV